MELTGRERGRGTESTLKGRHRKTETDRKIQINRATEIEHAGQRQKGH